MMVLSHLENTLSQLGHRPDVGDLRWSHKNSVNEFKSHFLGFSIDDFNCKLYYSGQLPCGLGTDLRLIRLQGGVRCIGLQTELKHHAFVQFHAV